MKATILNREFQHPADGWYQIEVPGEHENKAGGVVQVIDGTAVASMVNRFNQEADEYSRKHGSPFSGMLIDHEHFKHDTDKESRAYGWLMRLQNRGGIPFGKIVWTATGKAATDGADYRFFSTEYDPQDLQVLNRGQKPLRVRPVRLSGLTLTNSPNNKGGKPITNRVGDTKGYGQLEEPEEFSMPELEKWFRAVKAVQDKSSQHTGIQIDFNSAWAMAKKQFPEIFTAAFGEDGAPAAEIDPAEASKVVTDIANRIKTAAQSDFESGWAFVRNHLPALFNRMYARPDSTSNVRCFNRDRQTQAPILTQKKAGEIILQLARTEQTTSGKSFDAAWRTVMNRHAGLRGLVDGSKTLAEARELEPEFRAQLA